MNILNRVKPKEMLLIIDFNQQYNIDWDDLDGSDSIYDYSDLIYDMNKIYIYDALNNEYIMLREDAIKKTNNAIEDYNIDYRNISPVAYFNVAITNDYSFLYNLNIVDNNYTRNEVDIIETICNSINSIDTFISYALEEGDEYKKIIMIIDFNNVFSRAQHCEPHKTNKKINFDNILKSLKDSKYIKYINPADI